MSKLQFLGNLLIVYKLKTLTGLHIGGVKESFEIGGLDNPVIKMPSSIEFFSFFKNVLVKVEEDQPFIPGSSLKGKVRSLLEWEYGDISDSGDPGGREEDIENLSPEILNIRKLFGISPTKQEAIKKAIEKGLFPVRIRVFDAYPLHEIETELKIENSINRITSQANPRNMERVPAGSEFEGKIIIRIFQKEDKKLLIFLLEGFRLLEDDYLGGGGSRGSGRVKFEDIKILFRNRKFYTGEEKEIEIFSGKFDEISSEKLQEILSNLEKSLGD